MSKHVYSIETIQTPPPLNSQRRWSPSTIYIHLPIPWNSQDVHTIRFPSPGGLWSDTPWDPSGHGWSHAAVAAPNEAQSCCARSSPEKNGAMVHGGNETNGANKNDKNMAKRVGLKWDEVRNLGFQIGWTQNVILSVYKWEEVRNRGPIWLEVEKQSPPSLVTTKILCFVEGEYLQHHQFLRWWMTWLSKQVIETLLIGYCHYCQVYGNQCWECSD